MPAEPILLDGRTGEGGGQLVRVACALAALTCQSVTIHHVRGNRGGDRGGGLKAQHVTSLAWLAKVTDAQVQGLDIGSKIVTFWPKRSPANLSPRSFKIEPETDASSALLVLQAILPYVLFAGNTNNEPVELDLYGGTNVSWSLSYEYFDQVLMPVLEERFGICVRRELKARGWSMGPRSRGHIALVVQPIRKGESLKFVPWPSHTYPSSNRVCRIDISIIVPKSAHEVVHAELVRSLAELYPGTETQVKLVEDSGHNSRWSILLVAHSQDGVRWGRDTLFSMPKPEKLKSTWQEFAQSACARLCKKLHAETSQAGAVDEFLQDQLIALQVLAEGVSTFPRGPWRSEEDMLIEKLGTLEVKEGPEMQKEKKTTQPFGNGSTHTTTARWVASKLLPGAEFYHGGDVVKGVGFSV
ncbi:hypothetical protein E4U13_000796 [Claviceps humidiphila]|uniref:RNA 3'-terminal phosphate cyclase domain-containing protein n=1 Tax=Claviceps humidiphila TaxID=1294629 RepID=A0A9P7Q3P2_9HYPO|nr:hypothetical protein E4U13_000796 [Claviceps humidiphila]